MSYYVGEITMLATPQLPAGWMECDGTLLNITDYPILFSVISNTYGGDGTTTFALPDMRGRTLLGVGTLGDDVYLLGVPGGEEVVQLTADQIPAHSHSLNGVDLMGTTSLVSPPSGPNSFAKPTADKYYTDDFTTTGRVANLSDTGTNTPHSNLQPSLGIKYCIVVTNSGVS
jgi:microcystin-dependent protein